MRPIILLLSVAALALAACNRHNDADDDKGAKLSIALAGDDKADDAKKGSVTIDGDTDSGKFELKLPGGIEAKVRIPEGLAAKSKFDIDGVGLFPGAKVTNVNINAGGDDGAKVMIGFAAPGDAAAVADWYQRQFEAKQRSVQRSGATLSGKTEDGDDFTLAIAQAAAGSRGVLTIVDHSRN
jgi:hypothetical protein